MIRSHDHDGTNSGINAVFFVCVAVPGVGVEVVDVYLM